MINQAPTNQSPFFGDTQKIDNPQWVQWFQQFYDTYNNVFKYLDPTNPVFGKAEPSPKYTGMIAFANGTDWNPISGGAGYYRWTGAAWTKLP